MPPMCCKSEPEFPRGVSSGLRRGVIRLAIGLSAILLLWLGVLPRIAVHPPIQRHIEFLEQQRIDPSAVFYTELEIMGDVRARITEIRRQHPAAF